MIAGAPAANSQHEVTLKTKATGSAGGNTGRKESRFDEHGAATSEQLCDPRPQGLRANTRAFD